jgi:hypothetical protein
VLKVLSQIRVVKPNSVVTGHNLLDQLFSRLRVVLFRFIPPCCIPLGHGLAIDYQRYRDIMRRLVGGAESHQGV